MTQIRSFALAIAQPLGAMNKTSVPLLELRLNLKPTVLVVQDFPRASGPWLRMPLSANKGSATRTRQALATS
jgi:hypothetical protein